MYNSNLKLKGQYRVKVFDKNNQLKLDTDYLDNVITNTGLKFPFDVAFADCFRYLSLGSGQTTESPEDVSLEKPISEFQNLGIYKAAEVFGIEIVSPEVYPADTHYIPEGCGTLLGSDSVELFRTWRIPTGDGGVNKDYTGDTTKIFELITSPSSPIEMVMYDSGFSGFLPFIPKNNQSGAFSRIVIPQGFPLQSGDYAYISYKLIINPNTNPVVFSKEFDTTNFRTQNTFDVTPCTGWTGTISGVYNLIHPGIKLISDEFGPKNYPTPKELEPEVLAGGYKFGISYTPFIGAPLEPSNINSNYYAYVSTDNVQFLTSPYGQIGPTGIYYPYSGEKPPGALAYLPLLPNSGSDIRYVNIRMNPVDDVVRLPIPWTGDIRYSSNLSASTQKFSRLGSSKLYEQNTKSFTFTWGANLGQKIFSSVVLAVPEKVELPETPRYFYPFLDMVIASPSLGLLPEIQYTPPTPAHYTLFPNDINSKLFLDGLNTLDLTFYLSWDRA